MKGYHYSLLFNYNRMLSEEHGYQGILPRTTLDINPHGLFDMIADELGLSEKQRDGAYDSLIREFFGLPNEAYQQYIKTLLNPKPQSWIANPRFPKLWQTLMLDIFRCDPWDMTTHIPSERKLVLLSFKLEPDDEAYVFEEAYTREMHENIPYHPDISVYRRERLNQVKSLARKYWDSKVSVSEYDGRHSIPLLAVSNPIPAERLEVMWIKRADEIEEVKGFVFNGPEHSYLQT